ncbi:hypothetical protein NST41_33015 [Paenibacillus sp. FSL L8-0696]|uniref:hypothetical protein n=1 Tax=Paenibacillus sp. FSL L8-0696 TaxID=2954524 RepID=UPI003119E88E
MEVCYLYGIIASREYIPDLKEVIGSSEIWFERVGDFSDEDFMIHSQAAMSANVQVLFIDMTCAEDNAIIRGIKQYRLKRDNRIIMIAPNRVPGDPTITALISLQVLDFISFTVEVDEEEETRESISYLVKQQLNKKPSYGNVARWNVQTENTIERSEKARLEKRISRNKSDDQYSRTLLEELEALAGQDSGPRREIIKQPELIIMEKMLGTALIAVGGTGRRTGASHTAIQISNILQELSESVACVELLDPNAGKPVFKKFRSGDQSASIEGGFRYKEVDYYPEADMKQYLRVLSGKYDYIVLDLGDCLNNQYYEEFFRAQVSILTCGSSVWDFDDLLNALDHLYQKGWNKHLCILVNLGDDEAFEMTAKTFSKKEKKHMNVDFYQGPFQPDPFLIDDDNRRNYESMLDEILPTENKKKRLFGGFFRR